VEFAQGGEEFVPVDFALADVEVLVDAGGGAGWVEDVAQAGVRRPEISGQLSYG
jgi:hypothetical protein